MTFTPIKTKHRNFYAWFETRPDLFSMERSPRKTTFWSVTLVVMAIIAVAVLLNAEAVAEAMSGRRRGALLGIFVVPPALVVVSAVMLLVGSRRWRVKGGGVLKNKVSLGIGPEIDIPTMLTALARGGKDDPQLLAALRAANKSQGNLYVLQFWSSSEDRICYFGLLRVDGNQVWIDQQPLLVSSDAHYDPWDTLMAATA